MLYESFLADGIPSFRKLFQFGWRLHGGCTGLHGAARGCMGMRGRFGQTLHRTRNMTKKDGEFEPNKLFTAHRIQRQSEKDGEFVPDKLSQPIEISDN